MKIACLVLTGGKIRPNTKRNNYDSLGFLGLDIIKSEIEQGGYVVDFCTMEAIYNYDIVLFSITAPEDITTFLINVSKGHFKKGNAKIIVGGAGCININSIYDFIDAAVFGRAEDQAESIINFLPDRNIWIKENDPGLDNKYEIRQASHLDKREGGTVGCRNKCYFCQYTWVRKFYSTSKNYSPTQHKHKVNEEDFKSLDLSYPGRYTTGLDGLSYATRLRVNKGFITDEALKNKIESAIALGHGKAYMLKLFGIIGYPWEDIRTAKKDAINIGRLFNGIEKRYTAGRLMAAIHLTPFSPEPLTPMEHLPANIKINWRKVFGGKSYPIVRNERLNIFIGPYTTTPPTLAKRVMINRCKTSNRDKIFKIITSGIDGVNGNTLHENIHKYLGYDIFGEQKPGDIVPYLKTYSNVEKIAAKMFLNVVTA